MQDYSQKRKKTAKANLKIKLFKLLINSTTYVFCVSDAFIEGQF